MYTPDRWVITKVTINDDVSYRVMGSWYGGYLGANSWRLSSGITDYKDLGDIYSFHNVSGSTYDCHKSATGMSSTAAMALERLIEHGRSEHNVQIEVIDIEQFLTEFKKEKANDEA